MENYSELAKQALKILRIPFSASEELSQLLNRIRYAIVLPGDTTEGEIMLLARQIADGIETNDDTEKLAALLKDLAIKVSYLSFD
jgi:hypothetical protein